MRRILAPTLAAVMCFASAAVAQAPTWTATAQPDQAGRHSTITVSGSGSASSTGQSLPQGITLALFKGFVVDLNAVAERCTSTASPPSCPTGSQAASGQFSGHASYLGTSHGFSGTIRAYLAPPSNGDLADVVAVVNVSGYGSASARGHVVAVGGPTFGYELRFDPLPAGMVPPGVTATIDQLTLTTGAMRAGVPRPPVQRRPVTRMRRHPACHGRHHRRCKRRQRRKHGTASTTTAATLSLITNPATCSAPWPLQVQIRYADHTDIRDTTIACAP